MENGSGQLMEIQMATSLDHLSDELKAIQMGVSLDCLSAG